MQGEISTLVTQNGTEKEAASLQFSFSSETGISEWIFVLVAPFATVQDSVTTEDFIGFWQNGTDFAASELVMDNTALAALTSLYGQPQGNVSLKSPDEILAYCTEK